MKKKKRVVAYARVSTNKNDQKNSFEAQQSYFQRELSKSDDYTLVILPTNNNGIYADRGWSGTKLVRPEFDKMLQDAGLKRVTSEETGKVTDKYEIVAEPKFDVIFVKDTTRFARTTSADDILKTLRKNHVIVHFLDIGRTTESLSDITAIQIFLSLGESESSRKSESVKFGYKEGARKGNIYMGGSIIGYDYIKKDNKRPYETNILVANKDAELVRLVFDLYTEKGLGHQQICKELVRKDENGKYIYNNGKGWFNSKGNQYTRSTISRMLENEKYIGVNTAGRYTYGDLFAKKQVEIDYNDEVRVKAREATQKLADDGLVQRIEPIIKREQFKKAQEIREKHRKKFNNNCTYHGITSFARKIKCGRCGAWYTAQSRKYSPLAKKYIRYYACSHRFTYDEANGIPKCNNPSIREDTLDKLLNSSYYYENRLNSIEEIQGASVICLEALENAIVTDNDAQVKDLDVKIGELTEEKNRLIPLFAKGIYSEEQLEQTTNDYNAQIKELTVKRNQLAKSNDEIRDDIKLVNEIIETANKEEAEVRKALTTGNFPERTQKEQLKDVEYISIDIYGNATIIFKSLKEIEENIEYIDSIRLSYLKDNSESEQPRKTLDEVLEEADNKGIIKVLKGQENTRK